MVYISKYAYISCCNYDDCAHFNLHNVKNKVKEDNCFRHLWKQGLWMDLYSIYDYYSTTTVRKSEVQGER